MINKFFLSFLHWFIDPFGDEEMWRAQYGQAIQSDKEVVVLPDCPVVDLWDWSMVMSTKKNGKGRVCRLVGRLIKKSTKLHPSMPSSRPLLKTAPICEAHLDLVRVRSGSSVYLKLFWVFFFFNMSIRRAFMSLHRQET